MAREAEARDVGHGMGLAEEAGGGALRAGHLGKAGGDVGAAGGEAHLGGEDRAGAERLRQDQRVAGAGALERDGAGSSARPVTVKPSVSSAPVVVWPPTISAPSAAKISEAASRISARVLS
jgi:hypothetical protein